MGKENEKRERTKESKAKESISLAHSARTREAAAVKKVRRKAPHLLPVLRLILKNGSNREESICELMAKIGTRKK